LLPEQALFDGSRGRYRERAGQGVRMFGQGGIDGRHIQDSGELAIADTMVIDTVGIRSDRPFAMVDMYGTPHTAALHVIERYRLLDHEAAKAAEERGENGNFRLPESDTGFARDPNYKGKGLQLQFTVEDDGVFTTPWSAAIVYQRPLSPLGEWPEFVCSDNRHEYYAGKDTDVPRADKPDF
jgi:hypothetical protein